MAEDGAGAAGEDGCHPPAELRDPAGADCVDASMQAIKAADCEAVADCLERESELEQLPVRNDPMLSANKGPNRASARRVNT